MPRTDVPSRYDALLPLGSGPLAQVAFGVLRGARGYRRPIVLKRAIVGSPEAEEALTREAHVAARLNHPNLIHVYELFEQSGQLILAMEYAAGPSLLVLRERVAAGGGRMPWAVAARIVADAARGLSHAHRARDDQGAPLGIIHRDVSPKNLVVTEDGITKVLDFGIARSAFASVTRVAVVKGTLGYLSPEQATGAPLSQRTDVFSLGTVLVELLTGRSLFQGADARATMEAVLRVPVPPLPPELPPSVGDVVAAMMARDPSHRTVALDHVADTLEAASANSGGSHRDVAAFVEAECGALLAHRRDRVRALLGGDDAAPPRLTGNDETSTLVLLEAALGAPSLDEEHPRIGADDDRTLLDGMAAPDATEIDLPD
ncbi:MAG: hypothetical protein DRJ42_05020 [Deltaproteobacteria bacterium]|nr:MAG: hypothetical protein DRJ42_05020 [Deltaproteobacteria bacterium]